MIKITRLALAAILFGAACGGDNKQVDTPLLAGDWETQVDTVRLEATFTGDVERGTVKLAQSVPGGAPTCEIASRTEGTYSVSGTSITITVTSARQTTSSACGGGATDTAIADLGPLQNFASALSGPFVLTEATLKLGSSYPTFNRVTP